ncbi:MAG: hypothetical protein WBG46_11290 [Nonlabens sp.]
MKNFILAKNQWLLERYPLIWNTKIVWMLAISIVLHIIFYLSGVISMIDPEVLQEYKTLDFFFDSGAFFFGLIISIVLLMLWLISMFRNNAFKNFYPTSRTKVFLQFVSYFFITMAATTFYYSFTLGMQTYIGIEYDDARMDKEIAIINKAVPLLPFDLNTYELDKLRLPTPFDTLYCETRETEMDQNSKIYSFKGQKYQFWSYHKEEVSRIENYTENSLRNKSFHNRFDDNRNVHTYYIKDNPQQLIIPHNTHKPSFYNYSDTYYTKNGKMDFYENSLYTKNYNSGDDFRSLSEQRINSIETNQKLLAQGTESVREALLNLKELADIYQIKNNLEIDSWLNRQSYDQPFEISELIHNGIRVYKNDSYINQQQNPFSAYERSLYRSTYFDASGLHRSLKNIDDIKSSNIFEFTIHVYLWIAFVFSLLVFAFRMAGLKPLLFALVAIGVLAILIALIIVFLQFILGNFETAGFATPIIVGSVILYISLFQYRNLKKLVAGVLLIISMGGFVPFLLTIIGAISQYQISKCPKYYGGNESNCFVLFEYLGIYWSYILLAVAFGFIYHLSKVWMNWRALPEG